MRFHGLMLVRDEADIIEQTLASLLGWADTISIFDTGSTDGTWEIVNDLAAGEPRIQLIARTPVVFRQSLRGYVFHRVRDRFSDGDWIVKLDADEFYDVTPPDFVRNVLGKRDTCVYLQWYFFRLTSDETADYESGRVSVAADRRRPIGERRRFYKIPTHSEPRMFRYRSSMKWSEKYGFPYHAGFVASERIPIRHYPHRDPIQMQRRYELRAAMKRSGAPSGAHWDSDDWRKDIILCHRGLGRGIEESGIGEGLSAAEGHTTGQLYYWEPGTRLPDVRNRSHLKAPPARLAQSVLHRFFLPIADRLRPGFSPHFRPGNRRGEFATG